MVPTKALDPDDGRIREPATEEAEVAGADALGEALPGFWESPTIEELAEQQGVKPITDVAALAADFWPPDMSADGFLALVDDAAPARP